MLHGIAQLTLWVALVVAVLAIETGALTLLGGRVALPWPRHRQLPWKPWGWALVALGLFLLLESAPRLAGLSAGWVLVLSGVALPLLLVGLWLQFRAPPTRT